MEFFATQNASTLEQPIDYGVCRDMLRKSIDNSGVTYWNLALLLPNALFLVYLSYHLGLYYRCFKQQHFPVVKVLLMLVFLVCVVSVIRAFAASIIKAQGPMDHHWANEVLWLFVRFLLLAVEISVIGFGLFGHGDDGVGKRVVSLSFFLALVYTTIQSCFEIFARDDAKIFRNKFMMFHHGGMLFWCISSSVFFVMYSIIVILPQTNFLCGRGFLSIPSNRAFYRYAAMLCVINLLESVGSLLVYCKRPFGLCILNAAVLLYYSFFAPLVYYTFLRKTFSYLRKSSSSDGYQNTEHHDTSSESTNDAVII